MIEGVNFICHIFCAVATAKPQTEFIFHTDMLHVMKKHQQGIKSMSMLTRQRLIAAEPSCSVLQSGDIKCNEKCQK